MGKASETKITKRVVDLLGPGEQVWDSALKGFGVRRQKDRPTYFVSYRRNGRRRWVTIGSHGSITADQARVAALEVLGAVAAGADPAAAKEADKASGTVTQLCERFLREYAPRHNKRSTVIEYERLVRLHIAPRFGSLRVNAVSQADVAKWHTSFDTNPFAGNRALALLKHLFNLAERWGLRTLANPARLVAMYPEKPRERLLNQPELQRLGRALENVEREGCEHPSAIACIRLLVLTGARLSEILKLRWEHVDFERGVLRLPDSKTGAKIIPLGSPALALLHNLSEDTTSPFVCPGVDLSAPFVGIQRPWRRVRARAGLDDLRIHDLRHAFASMAAMAGDSLYLIGKVLGHRQASTTERYAHLQDDPLRAVADRTSRRILEAMSSEQQQDPSDPRSALAPVRAD
jgi:integrase